MSLLVCHSPEFSYPQNTSNVRPHCCKYRKCNPIIDFSCLFFVSPNFFKEVFDELLRYIYSKKRTQTYDNALCK